METRIDRSAQALREFVAVLRREPTVRLEAVEDFRLRRAGARRGLVEIEDGGIVVEIGQVSRCVRCELDRERSRGIRHDPHIPPSVAPRQPESHARFAWRGTRWRPRAAELVRFEPSRNRRAGETRSDYNRRVPRCHLPAILRSQSCRRLQSRLRLMIQRDNECVRGIDHHAFPCACPATRSSALCPPPSFVWLSVCAPCTAAAICAACCCCCTIFSFMASCCATSAGVYIPSLG